MSKEKVLVCLDRVIKTLEDKCNFDDSNDWYVGSNIKESVAPWARSDKDYHFNIGPMSRDSARKLAKDLRMTYKIKTPHGDKRTYTFFKALNPKINYHPISESDARRRLKEEMSSFNSIPEPTSNEVTKITDGKVVAIYDQGDGSLDAVIIKNSDNWKSDALAIINRGLTDSSDFAKLSDIKYHKVFGKDASDREIDDWINSKIKR